MRQNTELVIVLEKTGANPLVSSPVVDKHSHGMLDRLDRDSGDGLAMSESDDQTLNEDQCNE